MGFVLGIIVAILVQMGYVLFLVNKYRFSFGKALLIVCNGVIIALYLFGLVNLLVVAFHIIYVVGIVLLLYSIYLTIKNFTEIKPLLINSSIVMYGILTIAIRIFCF